ncbi:unnamed protein product, partial [Cyprideis torosa]
MNARSHIHDVSLELSQVEEVVCSIFHTILFHRCSGKPMYKKEGSIALGSIGIEDVDCDFMELTYVKVRSDELCKAVQSQVTLFVSSLTGSGANGGEIALEFHQKRRGRWLFSETPIPWEVWKVRVHLLKLANEIERQNNFVRLGEEVASIIQSIVVTVHKNEYVPKYPKEDVLDLTMNTSFSDIQPYHFRAHSSNGPSQFFVGWRSPVATPLTQRSRGRSSEVLFGVGWGTGGIGGSLSGAPPTAPGVCEETRTRARVTACLVAP